ncbi:MAG: T9SS type A sorting domain-containing protein [Saprospiraceae bacterium]|nr:T9SS type A sorting domain-containing protein [Saprospiraceae bacterium]
MATASTYLTDMGYDPVDSNLCVMQFSVFSQVDSVTLDFFPGTGKVIKIMPNGDKVVIADGFIGLTPSFTFDAVGDLYVTDLFGFVYKFDFVSGTSRPTVLATNVQAFPNPFTDRVSIGFELKNAASVKANIYDLNGRLVKAFDEEKLPAGQQSLTWEASSAQPGMYIYHLLVDGRVVSGLLQLAR